MSGLDATVRERVIEIAEQAGAAIMQVYASGFDVEHKADDSPVTTADLAAHRLIVQGLSQLTPDIPVLSEESAQVAWETRRQWSRYWLVDPLDGTREFIKRNGEFSVNIALIDGGAPVFGVVQAPVTGLVWHAERGVAAYRREGQQQDVISTRVPPAVPLRVAASRSHRSERTQTLLSRMGEIELIAQGSSLKFCRIAEGTLDVYPRLGPTSEWDTAAGQCVLEAAGGVLLAADSGLPFQYNQRSRLLNGDFVALGDATLPWQDWVAGL
ncbi:3'-5'-bisphosphate nucleotidase [Stenotrophomonas humi]|uniref:3'(2'),5'-bisphosphate nucleotidase CysQ n=1 Tax=Stenotrophomonas humi TaxID=405444 RepID=A0A0R0C6E0_9GAMM|nr:3'(2'),5'-bisphosphate nucleotidase CysQ [Stenotrophomonas humi]KRG64896.1 3'-5'-bisphosphate nucleotidase [Stenotrophomonas humi]